MRKSVIFTISAVLVAASIPQAGRAQRLYNKERDDQAQAALPLAKSLQSGELFGKQLKNFASLVKKDFDTEFLVTRFQINAFTLDLLTWGSAHTQVCQIEMINSAPGKGPSDDEVKAALGQLKLSIAAAQTSLDDFKKSIKAKGKNNEGQEEKEDNSVLATLFNSLGELESLKDFAEEVGKTHPKFANTKILASLQQIQDIAAQLKKVYDAYKEKVDKFNELEGNLAELRLVLKKVAIQSLQVDEDHWKNIASIRARRETESADVLALVNEYKNVVARLKLVDYPPTDPGRKDSTFCTIARSAETGADGLDIRPHQMITVLLQNLIVLGESMAKSNQSVEDEAIKALRKIRPDSSESTRRAASEETLKALDSAIKSIKGADQIHEYQQMISAQMETDGKTLATAITNSNEASVKALQSIIINARKNRVTIRNMVGDIPRMLFIVSALIARGSTPARLADLRMAQELHAYSIRKSAVRARAYELTVSTAAQRLALFHQGGIKPTNVAELVFAASNIAITPAILAR